MRSTRFVLGLIAAILIGWALFAACVLLLSPGGAQ